MDLPKYRCHKVVQAEKITAIEWLKEPGCANIALRGIRGGVAVEGATGFRFMDVTEEDLGYYVRYEDGYVSWSPTLPFDRGYTLMTEHEKLSKTIDDRVQEQMVEWGEKCGLPYIEYGADAWPRAAAQEIIALRGINPQPRMSIRRAERTGTFIFVDGNGDHWRLEPTGHEGMPLQIVLEQRFNAAKDAEL